MSVDRPERVLAALFLGTFVLGTTEMLVVGVLNLIATDLGVSVPAAGGLVTAFALGLAVGGPLLTAVTIRLDRRVVLVGALSLVVVGVLLPVVVGSYPLFVVARVLTGALTGLFIAVAFAVGTSVVEPARTGRAISIVFSGFAVSTALGVPLGTLLGQVVGWRGAFVAVVAVAVVALAAVLTLVPKVPGTRAGVADQARHAFAPRVLAVLTLLLLVFAALYSVLTYVVPFLETVTGVSGAFVSLFLLVYGAATAVGSIGGGRFADGDAARTLVVATAGVTVCLLALRLVGGSPAVVAVVLAALGLVATGMVPSLQYRVVELAGPGGTLAQSLPASAANIGVALGSLAGGATIGNLSIAATTLTGAGFAVVAAAVAVATRRLRGPTIADVHPVTGSQRREEAGLPRPPSGG
jgi:DHA1 family inner membrane transport protein